MAEREIRNLNYLRVFIAVVEHGSFTAAADRLCMSKSLVSEYLGRLEAEIDTQLVLRSTRKIAPTDAGHTLFLAAQECVSHLHEAVGNIRRLRHESTGLLRVAAPAAFSSVLLSRIVATFADLHPRIDLEMLCNDHGVDLIGQRIDLAFETGWPKKKGFRMKMLGAFEQYLVASPDYARQHAAPHHPNDLPGEHWISHDGLANAGYSLFINNGQSARIVTDGRLKVQSVLLALELVLAGAGVGVFPDYLVANDLREGRLCRLLPAWTTPPGGIYAFRTAARHASIRERLFLDAVRTSLSDGARERATA
ncbi:LysR family transcriptional regulator [Paraburkholderia sp. BL21I4N1]|uniref:LysR family transcriptional regulator n=1 Tax=Paraburkholderia sp. BL21I4N1 TaxID=1938801 RepID=UPI000CFADE68|nr:LysR family transcriptional regulator [Paraburkholderia sp. BL21I4N1]PQV46120.1 LysR family transcriptional regulator [Paraburkholderia sp. BL21I4N1]